MEVPKHILIDINRRLFPFISEKQDSGLYS